ncbi:hypothetical protein [Plantactinospora sp. GCM10030261]|uniref:hypothetical protein n=1 Tax=Plantactinospora sp. GCM10030261 TaxID=3273420 RepID=UPI0036094A95
MTQPDEDFTPGDHLAHDERDPEAPESDAVEQATAADPYVEETDVRRGLEVDDWDAMEQARIIGPDDDDYDR